MKNNPCSCECNLCNCIRGLKKKIQDFNEVWTHDLTIPVWCSNQLSYEAADVGSWSILCSYVPVKEMNVIDVYEMNNHLTCQMLLPWMPLCPKSEVPVCWLAPNRPVLLLAVFPNKLPPIIKHKEIQSWIVKEKFHTDNSWLQGLNNPTDFLTC